MLAEPAADGRAMATRFNRPPARRLILLFVGAAITLTVLIAQPLGAAAASSATHSATAIGQGHAVAQTSGCRQVRRTSNARRHRIEARRHRKCLRKQKRKERKAPAAVASSLYWGAWIGEQFTGSQAPWDMNAVSSFEKVAGKSLSLVNFSSPFADCSGPSCSYYKFPTAPMENVQRHGAIPFFSWASQSTPSSLNEPNFQLSDVINGTYDSYIREFAVGAKSWGHPFFLRFNWEMNGNWFPWSEGVNGNNPGEYVAAWRHVHDIFAAVGASNATWVWCPNVDPGEKLQDLASLYPGDEYVDWTCLDGYNWGTSPYRHDKWRTFRELFGSTYNRIVDQIAPSKPMMVGEVGSTEYGGSKAQWIAEMFEQVPTEFPAIHGLQWFEKTEEGDWPIESSPSSASAFAAGVQSSSFKENDYASLGTGPIPPPS